MLTLVRSKSEHPDFIALVKQLDAYLKIMDGDEHDFYNQFNHIDILKHTVIAYLNDKPVGCGAFKKFDNNSAEIKRMFTHPETRNKGVASAILKELEDWAKQNNFKSTILETGLRQVEAVNFYKKNNYKIIPNFGQYAGIENSVCFLKELR
ncbi:GNAT family N-acetyltransferase [Mesoflavibacter sp. CH_XMU1404-2]|uniref:GNAT family N-acetyltransferase n=1 Tax=Mesoflavibacter sp. CH_XMU1404-2 TaxID=3107766 RepID=UPI002440E56D